MITAIRRRLVGPAGRSDRGLSLVELIVSMALTTLVLAFIGSMLVSVGRITTDSNATTSRSGVASNVMNEIVKVIRVAATNPKANSNQNDPAVVDATPTSVTLYSIVDANAANPAPTKVRFRLDAQGNVFEDRWTATASSSYWVFNGTPDSRQIGGPVVGEMFQYLTASNTVLPATTGADANELSLIRSIKVTVQMDNVLATGSSPIVLTNTVGMANVRIAGTGN